MIKYSKVSSRRSARCQTKFAAHSIVALAAATLCGAAAADGPELRFSGFGTLGAVHSNDSNSDFTTTLTQPTGAGHTRAWAFGPDTKLGGQVNATFNDKFSAVLQVVAQHQYDNSYLPKIEWGNVKYQLAPEVAVRVGRIAAPSYLLSESRFVGYSYTWVRAPVEVYGVLPTTSNDGVDSTWRHAFGEFNNTLQGYYGHASAQPNAAKVTSNGWGISDSVEFGALTLRAGYNSIKLDFQSARLQGIINGLNQLGAGAGAVPVPAYQSTSAQALALAQRYQLSGMKTSAVALGAIYDPGKWFAMGEFTSFKGNDALLRNSVSWYTSSGYRFGSFTPYATYASIRKLVRPEPAIVGAPAPLAGAAAGLSAAINGYLSGSDAKQQTASVGLRWDFMTNLALKAQFDHVRLIDGTNGRLVSFAGLTPARSVNLVSAALDFVF